VRGVLLCGACCCAGRVAVRGVLLCGACCCAGRVAVRGVLLCGVARRGAKQNGHGTQLHGPARVGTARLGVELHGRGPGTAGPGAARPGAGRPGAELHGRGARHGRARHGSANALWREASVTHPGAGGSSPAPWSLERSVLARKGAGSRRVVAGWHAVRKGLPRALSASAGVSVGARMSSVPAPCPSRARASRMPGATGAGTRAGT
jgi:hypothetical protein